MSGKKHAEEEGGGHSVGLWYVSFSDMITLLLSFFVMLTTFSSFDKESLTKFAGSWAYIANYSIFPDDRRNDSAVPPVERVVDWTDTGSEKPTGAEPKDNPKPRESFWTSFAGAYQDRKVLYIASSRLFWGKGNTLTPAGREHLKTLAKFLKLVPCQVVVGQSVAPGNSEGGDSLQRSLTLVEFLQGESKCSPERFSISNPESDASHRFNDDPVVEIILLARSVGS